MKIFMLVCVLGVGIGMVGTLYRMRGLKNGTPIDARSNQIPDIFLGVGVVIFVVGLIGVVFSWNS